MMDDKLDINDVINGLLEQIASQARDIAVLKASIIAATKSADTGKN
jgi:cell division septum initiation protein DivIVA